MTCKSEKSVQQNRSVEALRQACTGSLQSRQCVWQAHSNQATICTAGRSYPRCCVCVSLEAFIGVRALPIFAGGWRQPTIATVKRNNQAFVKILAARGTWEVTKGKGKYVTTPPRWVWEALSVHALEGTDVAREAADIHSAAKYFEVRQLCATSTVAHA